MPTSLQTNFTAGQISSRLFGRTDISKYANGAAEILNMMVMQHGGAIRRSGTKFVAPIQDQTAKPRLIPFNFSVAQTYVLEFGNQTLRFYTNRGQLTVAVSLASPFASWSASVATLTVASHNAVVGDKITASVTGASNYDGTYIVTAVTATTISYALASDPGGTPSGGTVTTPYQITSPYTTAQLPNVKFTQSADILYLCHPDVQPKELIRSGATSWAFGDFDFQDGPYLDINTTTTTMTPSATTGAGITITASAVTGVNNGSGFASTDVGRLIRLQDTGGTAWGWAEIVGFTSTTVVTADVKEDFTNTTATAKWRLGAWTDTPIASGSTAKSWPWVPKITQSRMFMNGSNDQTQRVRSSNTADFNVFTPTSLDDDSLLATHSIDRPIDDDLVNAIYWMGSSPKGVAIGTDSGEFSLSNSAELDPLGPETVVITRQTSHGSKRTVAPQQAGTGTILFVQHNARKVHEYLFDFATDQFKAPDISVLAEDITVGGIDETAYQHEPFTTVWMVRGDGVLLGTTYERDQDVIGWHKHVLGGVFGSGDAVVESVAVVHDDTNTQEVDQVWLVVKRTINGATKRYVEYIEDTFEVGDDQDDAYFVDAGVTQTGSAFTVVTGLDHLEGQTVSVLADGATHPDKTVASGQVTLERSADKAHVGLPFDTRIRTLPVIFSQGLPGSRHKRRRAHKAHLQFNQTIGAQVGPALDDLNTIDFRLTSNPTDDPPPLFSGVKEVLTDFRYETEQQIYIVQPQPLPMTLLSITVEADLDIED